MSKKRVLTIGGSDIFSGGGIQSDIKTFDRLGVFGFSALTSLTYFSSDNNLVVEAVNSQILSKQLYSYVDQVSFDAIKIGLVASVENINVIADFLHNITDIPVILDPIIHFKESTDEKNILKEDNYRKKLIDILFSEVSLVTPNLAETEILTGSKIFTLKEMQKAGETIISNGAQGVLVKGGQRLIRSGADAIDLLVLSDNQSMLFTEKKVESKTVNGAGDVLSAAITAELAKGQSIQEAVDTAKKVTVQSIMSGENIGVNEENGSVG